MGASSAVPCPPAPLLRSPCGLATNPAPAPLPAPCPPSAPPHARPSFHEATSNDIHIGKLLAAEDAVREAFLNCHREPVAAKRQADKKRNRGRVEEIQALGRDARAAIEKKQGALAVQADSDGY